MQSYIKTLKYSTRTSTDKKPTKITHPQTKNTLVKYMYDNCYETQNSYRLRMSQCQHFCRFATNSGQVGCVEYLDERNRREGREGMGGEGPQERSCVRGSEVTKHGANCSSLKCTKSHIEIIKKKLKTPDKK